MERLRMTKLVTREIKEKCLYITHELSMHSNVSKLNWKAHVLFIGVT